MGEVYNSCSHMSLGGGFGLVWSGGGYGQRGNLVPGKGQRVCRGVGRGLHKTNLGSERSNDGRAGLVFIPEGQKIYAHARNAVLPSSRRSRVGSPHATSY